MDIRLRYMPDCADSRPVRLPGSKSMAARALVICYMLGADTRLLGMPDCNDTRELSAAFARLRAWKQSDGADIDAPVDFNLGEGGTSLRFFLAVAASEPGLTARIDCAEALRRRPLAPLIDVLRRAGADIRCLGEDGRAPLLVKGTRLDGSGIELTPEFRAAAGVSSQFVSALMMASISWKCRLKSAEVDVVSKPYMEMTRRMIDLLETRPECYRIEPDWSAASYFYEFGMITGRRVRFEDDPDPKASLQGDAAIARIASAVIDGRENCAPADDLSGELTALDMKDTPDLVPALAAGFCFAGIPFRFEDVAHLRLKETDRIAAVEEEMAKAGFRIDDGVATDGRAYMEWRGEMQPGFSGSREGRTFRYDSHNDHRMAMSMAITAAAGGDVVISGAEAVRKSFPSFFDEIGKLGFVRIGE